jgi:mRNA interferase RelE/StbE
MVALGGAPRPADSKSLEWPPEHFEPRRLKMGNWRIIYAVDDGDGWVWVLAVQRRPPYDYGDLARLLDRLR